MLRVLDLFSGIGGFSLGLERTGGFKTVAFCEIEPYCRAVLRKHWPDVPCFEDVRKLTAADVGTIDVICGGFPCQDISSAGKRSGIAGEQSGLWKQYGRLIGELRPRFALVENTSDLRARGFGVVLGDLAAIGYDAEWHCIPAFAIGAPIKSRDRIWILAVPNENRRNRTWLSTEKWPLVADPAGNFRMRENSRRAGAWWKCEPDMARVAHGVPSQLDRIAALGNAVVPQIPEIIGRAILDADSQIDGTRGPWRAHG